MNGGHSVGKNTVYLTIGSIAQKFLSFVYFTILARLLGPAQTGKYLYALSFMMLFSTLTDFGFQPVVIRETARSPEKTRDILKNALGIKLILSAVSAAALIIVARAIEPDPVRLSLISLAALVMVLDTIHLILYAVLRGRERLNYEAFGVVVGQGITILSAAAILLMRLPLPYLMLSLAAGSLWNVVFSGLMVVKVTGIKPSVGFSPPLLRQLIVLALPFALSAVFVKIYSSADSVMIGRFLGNQAVAIYGIPYKFAFAFQFVPIALAAALFPTLSRAYEHDRAEVVKIFASAERYLLLVVLPLIVGMSALAKPIISAFYGPAYNPSITVLQILSVALLSAFLDFPVGSLLNASRHQNVQTAWMGITMAANIVLNIFLIPRFGPVGAATAAVAGNFILFFGGLSFIPRLISVPWKKIGGSALRIIVSAGAMGLSLPFIFKYLGSIGFIGDLRFGSLGIPLVLTILSGAIIYALVLALTREIGNEDFQKISEFIRPGRKPVIEPL